MLKFSEVYSQAADLIEQVGWVRGAMSIKEGGVVVGYCASGAIHEVHLRDDPMMLCGLDSRCWRADAWLRDNVLDGTTTALWNDTQDDAAKVVATLRHAAMLAAEQDL